MNPIIAAILSIEPGPIKALAIINQLIINPLSNARLLAMAAEIEVALVEIERLQMTSKDVVERCLKLSPVAAPRPPRGF